MRDKPSLAAALYPNLSSEAKQREAQAAKDKARGERDHQALLRGLKELNAKLRAEREARRREGS
jgi:hypothetical protein